MMKKLSSSYLVLIVVLGSVTITTVLADTVTIGTYPYTIQDGSNNTRLVITSSGNVGIGTTSPNAKLSIGDNVYTSPLGSSYGQYQMILYDGGSPANSYGVGVEPWNIGFNSVGGYKFYQFGGGPIMVIGGQGSSNVGIGTTSPAQKLDVTGNIRLTGNIVSPNDICIGSC